MLLILPQRQRFKVHKEEHLTVEPIVFRLMNLKPLAMVDVGLLQIDKTHTVKLKYQFHQLLKNLSKNIKSILKRRSLKLYFQIFQIKN